MPKLSVILPVYNVEKYLQESLNCLVNQTFSDIEIICVNDCSTDNSLNILNEMAQNDSRIKIINNETNLGAGDSRNKGLDLATGEYILFLDSDDIFEPNLAENVITKAEENDCDIVIFNYNSTNNGKQINFKKNQKLIDKNVFSYKDAPDRIFNIVPPNVFSKLYKKSFLDENGIRFQSLKSCNDGYFALATLVLAKRISMLDKVLLHYRVNAVGNISSSRGSYYKNIISVMNKLKQLLEKENIYKTVEKSFIKAFRNHLRYEYKFVSKENKKDFIEYCKSSLCEDWKYYKIIMLPSLVQKLANCINLNPKKILIYFFAILTLILAVNIYAHNSAKQISGTEIQKETVAQDTPYNFNIENGYEVGPFHIDYNNLKSIPWNIKEPQYAGYAANVQKMYFAKPLINAYNSTKDTKYLDIAKKICFEWIYVHCDESMDISKYAWTEMIEGKRAEIFSEIF